jgi:type I restriction enzyme S subunit
MTNQHTAQVPKRRFPGFEGEWKDVAMGELLSFKNGYNAEKEQYGTGVKFINVLDIIQNDFITHDRIIGCVTIPEKDFQKNEVRYGDLLFQRSSETREEVGQSNVYLDKEQTATFGGFVIRGRPLKEFDSVYFNALLKTAKVRKDMTSRSGGATRYNIGQDSLEEVTVNLSPSLPEQQKIAAFLTAVDGRIEQLSRKKALLEATKKGVMQQLFTQTLRFQDDHGHDFPDWEEKTLGELTTWTSGGTPSKDEPSYWDGDIPWLSAASMHERYYDDSPLKISEEGLRNGSRIAKKGSLLLLVRGSMLWNRIPVGIATRDLAFNQDVKALALTKEVQAEFLLQWFIASENMLLHTVVGTGIGAGKLDTEEMKRLQVLLPSLPEQTKIAGFLSAMDGKIAAVGEQMRQTQAWKKGLLQQMFV